MIKSNGRCARKNVTPTKLIIFGIIFCQFIIGCIPRSFNNFGSRTYEDDEIAMVRITAENIQIYEINDSAIKYKLVFDSEKAHKNIPTLDYFYRVRLIPGKCRISWDVILTQSRCSHTIDAELKAGHEYLPTASFFWPNVGCVLKDNETGELLK